MWTQRSGESHVDSIVTLPVLNRARERPSHSTKKYCGDCHIMISGQVKGEAEILSKPGKHVISSCSKKRGEVS